jgi:hypothetical protein
VKGENEVGIFGNEMHCVSSLEVGWKRRKVVVRWRDMWHESLSLSRDWIRDDAAIVGEEEK